MDKEGTDTGIPVLKVKGIGVIPATTPFHKEKETISCYWECTTIDTGREQSGSEGYEIHLGDTILLKK